jgi:hypothetical protein
MTLVTLYRVARSGVKRWVQSPGNPRQCWGGHFMSLYQVKPACGPPAGGAPPPCRQGHGPHPLQPFQNGHRPRKARGGQVGSAELVFLCTTRQTSAGDRPGDREHQGGTAPLDSLHYRPPCFPPCRSVKTLRGYGLPNREAAGFSGLQRPEFGLQKENQAGP